jgi:hypothetical protein
MAGVIMAGIRIGIEIGIGTVMEAKIGATGIKTGVGRTEIPTGDKRKPWARHT